MPTCSTAMTLARQEPTRSISSEASMTTSFLIDGYNLAHIAGLLSKRAETHALRGVRRKLLQQLADAHGTDAPVVTIVFDAHRVPRSGNSYERFRGLHVRFSCGYPSADDLIEELISQHPHPKQLTVVSDDHRLRDAARRRHCRVLGCLDYLEELQRGPPTPRSPPVPEPEKLDQVPDEERRYWEKEFADLNDSAEMKELWDDFGGDFEEELER